jgi:hypothetical protein
MGLARPPMWLTTTLKPATYCAKVHPQFHVEGVARARNYAESAAGREGLTAKKGGASKKTERRHVKAAAGDGQWNVRWNVR